jgi:hypothetical protein
MGKLGNPNSGGESTIFNGIGYIFSIQKINPCFGRNTILKLF